MPKTHMALRFSPRRRTIIASAAFALTALASAAPAFAAPPNDGHIHVHDESTPVDTDATDAKVACFYIDAFQFTDGETLNWSVFSGTAGNPGTEQAAGSAIFTATGTHGQDISGPIKLSLGKYVAFEDDIAGRKTKEFEVTGACSNGVPAASPHVVAAAGAVAAPGLIGYFLWRRRRHHAA